MNEIQFEIEVPADTMPEIYDVSDGREMPAIES